MGLPATQYTRRADTPNSGVKDLEPLQRARPGYGRPDPPEVNARTATASPTMKGSPPRKTPDRLKAASSYYTAGPVRCIGGLCGRPRGRGRWASYLKNGRLWKRPLERGDSFIRVLTTRDGNETQLGEML
jgi:hypothetical protein